MQVSGVPTTRPERCITRSGTGTFGKRNSPMPRRMRGGPFLFFPPPFPFPSLSSSFLFLAWSTAATVIIPASSGTWPRWFAITRQRQAEDSRSRSSRRGTSRVEHRACHQQPARAVGVEAPRIILER